MDSASYRDAKARNGRGGDRVATSNHHGNCSGAATTGPAALGLLDPSTIFGKKKFPFLFLSKPDHTGFRERPLPSCGGPIGCCDKKQNVHFFVSV